jgi:hypothetical protein
MKFSFIEMVELNKHQYSVYLKVTEINHIPQINEETATIEVVTDKEGKPINAFLLDEGFINQDYDLLEVEKEKAYNYLEDLKTFHIVEF